MGNAVARTTTVRGVAVPTFLYGTAWKEAETGRLVRQALSAGFRGFDTANQRRHYDEAAVGAALASAIEGGEVERGDLFLQSKYTFVHGQDHRLPYDPEAEFRLQVKQSLESSLEHLSTDYLDSYVLHGPSTRYGLHRADWEVWRAMEELANRGRVKQLGVSNVTLAQLEELCSGAGLAPAFVQNRCFASMGWDQEVRQYCERHGIRYQGFSLLTANWDALSRPATAEIAERRGRSVPQVVFRFALQSGIIPLTGTSDPAHMQEDLECYDFELSPEELAELTDIAR